MEIDLSGVKKEGWTLAGIGLAVIIMLMLLGRAFTPPSGGLLTWQEWQIRKARQAYLAERQELRLTAERLAALLTAAPDPARAQVVVQEARQRVAQGRVETLQGERETLLLAAQAVLDWASGMGDYNRAVDAVQSLLSRLNDGG